jgi:hypothetical protein
VLRRALRSSFGLVEEFSKCIEADLGSEVVASTVKVNESSTRLAL